jgi:diadenosine tetraphosphate (Ap4A) HIT family hydrolase
MARALPASTVYEDERALAFLDIHPITPGHTLVVPRYHAPGLTDLDEETGAHLFVVALRVQRALRRSGLRCEGVNLLLSDGAVAGQEVPHAHLHVLPRFTGDGFTFTAHRPIAPSRAELEAYAERIRRAL